MCALAIDLTHVSKRFGDTAVLEDISLQLPAGKFLMLAGRDELGKSTLLRIIARRERISSGGGKILGHELEDDLADCEAIAFVSESFEVQIPLKLSTVAFAYAGAFPRWDQDLFERVMRDLGLSLNLKFPTLKREQRVQLAMALALASRPQLFVLEEVWPQLDRFSRQCLIGYLLQQMRDGATIVVSTTDPADVEDYADLHAVVEDGHVYF